MAQIDPTIALGTSGATPVKVLGPADIAQQGLTLSDLYARNQMAQGQVQLQKQQILDQQTLASLYKQNTNSDGTIDAPGIVRGLGQAGAGHLIPAFQTQQQALAEKAATTGKAVADTNATNYDTLTKSLGASAAGIGSLLANPNVGHDDVVHQLATQVKQGTLTLDHAQNTISDMPPTTGNAQLDTQNLHNWLVQQNLKIADAKTRLDATVAKPTAMNNGKVTTMVDTNAITNPGIIGANMRMTTTPGEDLSFQTANNTIEQTPGGFAVVNKATGKAAPVTDINGAQTLPVNSPVFKNEQQLAQNRQVAQMAADILQNKEAPPTHSGVGNLIDKGNQFLGIGTDAQANAAKLQALGGWMTANVPRMEGPQSDADRAAYAAQAGQIGDASLPISTRLAALQTVVNLQSKYGAINGGNGATPLGTQPVTVMPANTPPAKVPQGARPPLSAFYRK